MSLATDDLGVLGNLAVALGIFTPEGPNPDWFANPEASLKNMLADEDQRGALIAFVDEAMGGADRETDPRGVIWLPIVTIENPDLAVSVTVDQSLDNELQIGLGLRVRTAGPRSTSSLAIPLFRAQKGSTPLVSDPLLLGSDGGRLRLSTAITIDEAPPVPGQARLGAIGIDMDLPTSPGDPADPIFGISLTGFQLPGATAPRDIRVAADGIDELDDAVLDLVLSLVKAQADTAAAGSLIAAVGGLLGLKSGDNVPDFPITQLPAQGVQALAAWILGIVTSPASRADWIGHLASLLNGTREADDTVSFGLGGSARLTIGLRVDTGPTGNTRLTPILGINVGAGNARVEARADLFQIDLVSGAALALPQLGLWAAAGGPAAGDRVLNVTNPTVARADTLRIGFALDAQRRLTFVLAADNVVLGTHTYPVLDLTSPDAVMDAVGNTVSDVAAQLLNQLGGALNIVRLLLGLDAPAGIAPIDLPALMTDPLAAVSGYWRDLANSDAAMKAVLAELRSALADASEAASSIRGTGTAIDPWRVPLIGPLVLEISKNGPVLAVGIAALTSVDTLGARCTVVETRFAATLAELDLTARTASLVSRVESVLSARERGINPPRASFTLDDGVVLSASGVGIALAWSPATGLAADVYAPNLTLTAGGISLPVALPVIAANGTVTLPAEAWDGVEALVGYLGELLGGFLRDAVNALGWATAVSLPGGIPTSVARLPLRDLIADPATALSNWIPQLLMSEVGPQALGIIADLFAGSGANRGFIVGTGHPDDPYRLPIGENLPNLVVWFPPEGLEHRVVAAPEALQRWRPGDPGLSPSALAAALAAEATVAADVRALVDGRNVEGGLAALASRWIGGDGRIVPPVTAPAGVTIDLSGLSVGQFISQLDLEDLTGRTPTTTVYVALGEAAWPDAPAGRRVDLTAPMLEATMFAAPSAPDEGDWFVALGTRTDSMPPGTIGDGTPEQAARLARVLNAFSGDIVLVAVAGAGHAARVAAQAESAVTDLITLGTPLGPISLTAIGTQPTADALRLLHRLLPPPLPVDETDPDAEHEDEDLALGRGLVGAMMELVDRIDPTAELIVPSVPPPPPRAGLAVTAVFGAVSESQVIRAITAIVASGLAERARMRAATALPEATGVRAGVQLAVAQATSGTVSASGDALVTLFSYDTTTGIDTSRELRVRLRVADRSGWLSATPDLELRMVTADISIPLDSTDPGRARVTLHDARVYGESWEQLVLGNVAGAVPVLPEARVLLAAAMQRITADVTGTASVALTQLLTALGIIDPSGGVAADAVDQLVHDPGGLIRQRLAIGAVELSSAVQALLGPLGATVDLNARSVRVAGGSDAAGRFGWHGDVTASPAGLTGQLRFGPDVSSTPVGKLNFVLDLNPLQASMIWQQPGGTTETITLWPSPDAAAIARVLAKAAPSLGAHAAIELMRRADETTRPLIDAILDALGALAGAAGDANRSIRPLAGLLSDPAGWLRSPDSLAANPAKIQALFDALRPLVGVAGAPGSPIPLANGVSLGVVADGPGARLTLDVTPTAWAPPPGVAGRLAAGLSVSLTVGPSGPPAFGLDAHVGLTGAAPGREAVHTRLGPAGVEVFLRPATGSDIALVPFAGLGALAAAEAALPFLLDKLAAVPGTVGNLVQGIGDMLNLRSDTPMPRHFDSVALRAWAANPVGALTSAGLSITPARLTTIAPLLDTLVPTAVDVTATANALTVAIGGVSLGWTPADGIVSLVGSGLAVPGVDEVSFVVSLSDAGLEELSVTVGPADIDAGGVTLRPFVTIAAGLAPASGRRVAVGMAVDNARGFGARWLLDTQEFALVASNGVATALDVTAPDQVAVRIVEVVADLVAAVALAQQAVQDLLDTPVAATTVRGLMRGVVLEDVAVPSNLIAGVFDPATLLPRVHTLFVNLAGANIPFTLEGLTFSIARVDDIIGLQVALAGRAPLVTGDVMLWLENDGTWIQDNTPPNSGLFVGFLPTALPLTFAPSLTVLGVGLRVGKSSGPLLDFGITLESIALHAFAGINTPKPGAGVQLEFTNLAVPMSGAGGQNGIAQGVMRDTGPTPPQPAFSPALAVQKHGNDPVSFTMRAGVPPGPWWLPIRRGFGPLYLEQIGFGTAPPSGTVERVSLLMDGSVSMFGLTCAVDDLQITYDKSHGNGDFFNSENWEIDLAGLAVSADMAGLTIAGGLLKQTTPDGIEYLGMLLGRFAVYGLTIYGGYGEGEDGGQKFTSFFAVGAINGPIGGPPAFFLTGIGGGFGINRRLLVPTDLSTFGNYPLIQALDIAASPQDPMTQLRALGQYFPMRKGTFWFAAGLSFNSFALVDGIAVVAVQVGDGLDISLLGLARMALPRPQVALVSIELALVVRFSSSEGVLWVQGQLTDNSWLLYPDIKLTGGFAYVLWFKGEHAGEFVLTLGGYHPDFHRDGYPQVPRLGLRWSIGSTIVIKAGSYFALTSEALMAGGDFEASADFGAAWAEVRFGAHGIIYFDPFHYHVNAYARISAGVTIDTWLFGEITISISIGARIDVTGPEFHGSATFEVGPIELTVEFGGSDQAQKQWLGPGPFVEKYLEAGDGGAARAHAVITSHGALPAKGENATPDGSAARPFVVVVEFGLTFTSTVPATTVTRALAPANATTQHPPSGSLGVAPMNQPNVLPTITVEWQRGGTVRPFPFSATPRPFSSFPAGIWGMPQDTNNRKVPKGDMIEALNELDLVCRATATAGGPEIPYYQVEINKRKPLPFTRRAVDATKVKTKASAVADLVTQPTSVSEAFTSASKFLVKTARPTTLAALRGERQAPPLLGTLAEGIAQEGTTVVPGVGGKPPVKVYDHFVDPPMAVGLLAGATMDLRVASPVRTTVKDSATAWRVPPPTLAGVEASRSRSIAARLVLADLPALCKGRGTAIGPAVPPSAIAHGPTAIVARTASSGAEHLGAFTNGLTAHLRTSTPGTTTRGTAGATLAPGQIAVLKMPNARADTALDDRRPRFGVRGAPARIVVLGHGGVLLVDRIVSNLALEVPRGSERIILVGQSPEKGANANSGLAGWHAGKVMPYAGWSAAVGPGCVVRSTSDPLKLHRERLDAGWVAGAELARGVTTVVTTFTEAPRTVVIVLDDPAAFGGTVGGRALLLGLDGASRARDSSGREQPPVLLAMESRSVLAYDIVPQGKDPVAVTIASETGWSLVGVMGSAQLDAAGAIAFISARGLDSAIQPFASKTPASELSLFQWVGPARTTQERMKAKLRAAGRLFVPEANAQPPEDETKVAPPRRNARTTKPRNKARKAKRPSTSKATGRARNKKEGQS
jgi:large repetitive protein